MSFTKDFIKEKLLSDTRWLEHGVLAIYNRQTYEEKNIEKTKEHNGVGFTSSDARYLTYVAKWISSGKHLSGRHLEKTRRQMVKYSGQLTKIANMKGN
ncbi:MAG: hypothetical protein AB7V16_07095 [Vulcanibacillus sp.]